VSTINITLQGVKIDKLAYPGSPRGVFRMVKTVEQLEHQARVLDRKLLDAEPALKLGEAGFVPGNQALCAANISLPRPEESPSPLDQGIDSAGWEEHDRHEVSSQAIEDRVDQDQVTCMVQ